MAGRQIPVALAGAPSIEIEGALVARGLGLDVTTFRQLMSDRRITVLCERGTGEDAGLYRASFHHGDRCVRLVVTADGSVVSGPA